MSKRVLCKFFMHGACLKGEFCEFSHDWTDQPNNICTYYQRGVCSYGSRCRYDHIKLPRSQSSSALPSASHSPPVPPVPVPLQSPSTKPPWPTNPTDLSSDQSQTYPIHLKPVSPSDLPICSLAAAGSCPHGDSCHKLHGDTCPICLKPCLHPHRPEESDAHMFICQKNSRRMEALKKSQEIECSVCLDRVLLKPTAGERKFGLLSECDHPFCIQCIRNWRSNSPDSGMDVNSALRACPICRKLSYYVIPSVIWYFSKEEKQEIIDSYKAKLKSIDCRYFDFGNGSCPFGTSCFYKHAFRDGSLEEVVLRHLDADDGSTVIFRDVRLADFLNRLHL